MQTLLQECYKIRHEQLFSVAASDDRILTKRVPFAHGPKYVTSDKVQREKRQKQLNHRHMQGHGISVK